jgi:hypothetical protein
MAGVPNVFGSATTAIPLSQLDQNFATAITLGNTAMYLGNTTTAVGNLTLNNVTITSGTSNIAVNVSTATGTLAKANGGTGTSVSAQFAQVVSTETGAVSSGTTQIPFNDTIPQNTQGDQYMSLAITPINSSSTLYIEVFAFVSNSGTNNTVTAALFQDSTVNSLAAGSVIGVTATGIFEVSFRHKMTAGTTSSTTFKVRIGGSNSSTTTFNGTSGGRIMGGVFASSLTITEILP